MHPVRRVAVKGEGKLKENRAEYQMCVEMSDGTMVHAKLLTKQGVCVGGIVT